MQREMESAGRQISGWGETAAKAVRIPSGREAPDLGAEQVKTSGQSQRLFSSVQNRITRQG